MLPTVLGGNPPTGVRDVITVPTSTLSTVLTLGLTRTSASTFVSAASALTVAAFWLLPPTTCATIWSQSTSHVAFKSASRR